MRLIFIDRIVRRSDVFVKSYFRGNRDKEIIEDLENAKAEQEKNFIFTIRGSVFEFKGRCSGEVLFGEVFRKNEGEGVFTLTTVISFLFRTMTAAFNFAVILWRV